MSSEDLDFRSRLLQSQQQQQQTNIPFLQTLSEEIRRYSIISNNEELDDVNSEDLPAILVDYWLGTTMLNSTTERDPEKRSRIISTAKAYLDAFAMRCVLLGIRKKKSADDDMNLTTAVTTTSTTATTSSSSANNTREQKIARFKTLKMLKDSISQLEQSLLLKQTFSATTTATNTNNTTKTFPANDDTRDLWILRIRLANESCTEDIESAEKELSVLEFMMKSDPKHLQKIRDERIQQQKEPGSMDVTKITPSLQIQREIYKDGVFKPYHNLPTMSLEEFADKEMKDLREREERSKQDLMNNPPVLSLNELLEQGLEDDDVKFEASTLKARKWDDWKDGVPKGAGVTKQI
jgi:immunoglobulin-binding protein 1